MNDLSPDAFRQTARDATTKITVASGTPQALLAWFLRQGWKVKFLLAAILMFCGYAAFIALFDTAAPDRTCPASMPREQRADCIIALEDAAAARAKALRARQDAEEQKVEADQLALQNEIRRKRAVLDARPLKEAFDKRLMEIVTANPPVKDFAAKMALSRELNYVLLQYLRATDHPLNQLRGPWDISSITQAIRTDAGRTDPPRFREAKAAIYQPCNLPMTRPSSITCAEALKLWIDKLSFQDAENQVERLVLNSGQP